MTKKVEPIIKSVGFFNSQFGTTVTNTLEVLESKRDTIEQILNLSKTSNKKEKSK